VAIRITDPDTDQDPYRDTGKTCLLVEVDLCTVPVLLVVNSICCIL